MAASPRTFTVDVGVADRRPPRTDRTVRVRLTAHTEAEAHTVAALMACCTEPGGGRPEPVMPVSTTTVHHPDDPQEHR